MLKQAKQINRFFKCHAIGNTMWRKSQVNDSNVSYCTESHSFFEKHLTVNKEALEFQMWLIYRKNHNIKKQEILASGYDLPGQLE